MYIGEALEKAGRGFGGPYHAKIRKRYWPKGETLNHDELPDGVKFCHYMCWDPYYGRQGAFVQTGGPLRTKNEYVITPNDLTDDSWEIYDES